MLISSSRKPSASTRTLCKHLASFFGCEYFNRGKMNMDEVFTLSHGTHLIIVGEYHGNPGSITIYGPEACCILSINLSVLKAPSAYPARSGITPSLEGDSNIIPLLHAAIFQDIVIDSTPSLSLYISQKEGIIYFKELDKVLFSLRIRSYRIYEAKSNGDAYCS